MGNATPAGPVARSLTKLTSDRTSLQPKTIIASAAVTNRAPAYAKDAKEAIRNILGMNCLGVPRCQPLLSDLFGFLEATVWRIQAASGIWHQRHLVVTVLHGSVSHIPCIVAARERLVRLPHLMENTRDPTVWLDPGNQEVTGLEVVVSGPLPNRHPAAVLELVVEVGNHRTVLPRLDPVAKQRAVQNLPAPSVGDVHQLLQLEVRDLPPFLLAPSKEVVGDMARGVGKRLALRHVVLLLRAVGVSRRVAGLAHARRHSPPTGQASIVAPAQTPGNTQGNVSRAP